MLLGAGAFLRFHRLGTLGLCADEGFMYLAVRGILERGSPVLETGFAYTRGPLLLYMQAWSAELFGLGPFALRFPAAVFGLACVPVAYAVGRLLLGSPYGWVLAAVVALSGWEVEMSRYARFYTPLQFGALAAVACFVVGFVNGRSWLARVGFVLAVAFALSLHPLAITLAVLPLLWTVARGVSMRSRVLGAAGTGVILAGFVVIGQVEERWAQGLMTGAATELEITDQVKDADELGPSLNVGGQQVLLPTLRGVQALVGASSKWALLSWAAVLAAGVGLFVTALRKPARPGESRGPEWVFGGLALASSAAGLFMLALVGVLGMLAWRTRRWSDLCRAPVAWTLVGVLGAMGPQLVGGYWNLGIGKQQAVARLFDYPDLGGFLIKWLWWGWPVVGLLLAVGVIAVSVGGSTRDDGKLRGGYVLVGSMVGGLCVCGLVGGYFSESRYFYHLYPTLLLIAAYPVVEIGRWATRRGVPIALVAVVLSGATAFAVDDLDPRSGWNPATRGYGDLRNRVRSILNWGAFADYHADHAGLGAWVQAQRKPGDLVVVTGPPHMTALYKAYCPPVDVAITQMQLFTRVRSGDNGLLIDGVTGCELYGDDPEALHARFEAVRAAGGDVWILTDERVMGREALLSDRMKGWLSQASAAPAHVGADGRTWVLRWPEGAAAPEPSVELDEATGAEP
ncbi:MAG: glycosyltransferase family 39 protein [Planctomycetota bacterium]